MYFQDFSQVQVQRNQQKPLVIRQIKIRTSGSISIVRGHYVIKAILVILRVAMKYLLNANYH